MKKIVRSVVNKVLVEYTIDGVDQLKNPTPVARPVHVPKIVTKKHGIDRTIRDTSQGPGTELKKLLHKIGFRIKPDCSCNQHAKNMNNRGPKWCAENIDTVVGWLKAEADRQRLPFLEPVAKLVVKRAIRNAEKAARQSSPDVR